MAPSRGKDTLLAVLSASLGLFALQKMRAETADFFEPILAACTAAAAAADGDGDGAHGGEGIGGGAGGGFDLVPHEPRTGGAFSCLVTQFLHEMVAPENAPAGLVAWTTTAAILLQTGLLVAIEAGRFGADRYRFNPVAWPAAVGLVSVLLGVGVVFPLIWLPSFLLMGGGGGGCGSIAGDTDVDDCSRRDGAVSRLRPYTAVCLSLPTVALTVLAFRLDPSTYEWTVVAGLLGGPIATLPSAILGWMGPPPSERATHADVSRGAVSCGRAYLLTSALSLGLWVAAVRSAAAAYGPFFRGDAAAAACSGLWTDAVPAVRIVTADGAVLFGAALCYIASVDPVDAIAVVLASVVVGPGAALGVILWGHERLRDKRATWRWWRQQQERSAQKRV